MSIWLKLRPIMGVISLILMPLVTIFLIALLCAKSGFLYGFPMAIQDCEMTKAILKGNVIDTQGKPVPNVEIHFENTPVDFSTPVKQTISGDKSGHFGPESIHFFKCEPINFTIRAATFHETRVSYIFELLPSKLDITLERSS